MPFIARDEDGSIRAIFKSPTEEAREELATDDPEIVEFMAAGGTNESLKWELFVSDLVMGRLTEDLIDVLVEKNILAFTDLSEAAQKKLLKRRQLRERLQAVESLVDDEGGIL